MTIKNGQGSINDLFYDIKQAHINMQIQFENTKNYEGVKNFVSLGSEIPLIRV